MFLFSIILFNFKILATHRRREKGQQGVCCCIKLTQLGRSVLVLSVVDAQLIDLAKWSGTKTTYFQTHVFKHLFFCFSLLTSSIPSILKY